MKKLLVIFLVLISACNPLPLSKHDVSVTRPLISIDWLDQNKTNTNIRIIELAQTTEQYSEGHIPGAIYINWLDITDPDESERYNILTKQQLEQLLGKLGINNRHTIVLYDDLDNRISSRMFWTLRYYGHKDVRILDGGKSLWRGSGKPLTVETPGFGQTSYRIRRVKDKLAADKDFILSKLDDTNTLIIDGRPPKQYTGEIAGSVFHTGVPHKRTGHIKGAVNIFWKDNLNADGTFKSPQELTTLYESYGAAPDKLIITYCNEGLHASPPWFVLHELLGYPNVGLYDDSMSEWANLDDTPMRSGSNP